MYCLFLSITIEETKTVGKIDAQRALELLQPIFEKKKALFLKPFGGKIEVLEQKMKEALEKK